jgi:hypothetical protein
MLDTENPLSANYAPAESEWEHRGHNTLGFRTSSDDQEANHPHNWDDDGTLPTSV